MVVLLLVVLEMVNTGEYDYLNCVLCSCLSLKSFRTSTQKNVIQSLSPPPPPPPPYVFSGHNGI